MKKKLLNGRIIRKITIFVCLLLSGCIFAPKHEVATYDLGIPKKLELKNATINVMPFLNSSETGFQMVYRVSDYEIKKDIYNRWNNNPGKMLTQYLKKTFSNDFAVGTSSDNDYTLNGTVIRFEADLRKNIVILSINYSLLKNGDKLLSETKTYEEHFKEYSPLKFAICISRAAGKFSEYIAEKVKKYSDDTGSNMLYLHSNKKNPFMM